MTQGSLCFPPGVETQTIDIHVNPKRSSAATSDMLVFLEQPQSAQFDPETDGGDEAAILTVRLLARTDGRRLSQTFDSIVRVDSLKKGGTEWRDQFRAALFVGGSEEEQK